LTTANFDDEKQQSSSGFCHWTLLISCSRVFQALSLSSSRWSLKISR